ncbi:MULTISPECIES: hypothetical protein [unclassified Pseudomonas]|uniref:hypothetical protein n=1 Tax=unclassified Pseudomonas TaxID=196821 RepID=UPI0008395442|nr:MULTISPECIES: hypothetical protein [unclassified Pseudomonas]QIH05137.1 hypothetical protein ATY02_20880 [Pseudomonas sp. BIOMIG1BAC]
MTEENEIALENPAVKAAIATAVEASVSGLKTKNSELLGKLKETTGKLTQFEGIDKALSIKPAGQAGDIAALKAVLDAAGVAYRANVSKESLEKLLAEQYKALR